MKIGILFDLDGTLLDTLEDLHQGVNHALDCQGYPRRTLSEVRRFVGNGAGLLIQRAVPEGGDWETTFAIFKAYYDAHCQERTRPYPGILQALTAIGQRYPVAIVSNKPDSAVKTLCAQYFPGIYALGERADCPRKPAPDMVLQAMEILGVARCVYVGDSEVDVRTSQNAGVPCLSVLWGFRDREELETVGAVHFCESPDELAEKIEELMAGRNKSL